MKKINGYKEIDRGDGLDGHVIFRDKFMLKYLDHRKGKRKYKEINNKSYNQNDNTTKSVFLFKKIIVNLKNFIFKIINK